MQMNKKIGFGGILIIILLCALIFLMGFDTNRVSKNSVSLYKVYLDGKKIGYIENKNELYNLIDQEQQSIKEKYGVDKIYPPKGLEVVALKTYGVKINSVQEIYEKIKDKSPFSIEGYEVTIKAADEEEKDIKFNLLNKEDLDIAIRNTVVSFVNEEALQKYIDSTQDEITDTGEVIDNVYLKQEIKIKEAYISTDSEIFTNPEDLSRYILFGTMEPGKEYTVKLGDSIETVATSNMLSVNEFLIANPNIVSANALLSVGQKLNISLINPLVDVVEETTSIEKQEIAYESDIEYDKGLSASTKYVKQRGSNGLVKVTFKNEIVNGLLNNTVQVSKEEITPVVNEIVVVGGYNLIYVGDNNYWAWPTNKPYRISSVFGPRWGSWHYGIDITGTGYGSPIYSIQSGSVIRTGYASDMGNYVMITHGNGYNSVYMHLSKTLVKGGDDIIKGQVVGLMGSTGRSTGTHLHLGVWTGSTSYSNSRMIDPLTLWK